MKNIKISDVIDRLNESLEGFLFANAEGKTSRECPSCKEGILSLKIGRYGSFIGCSRYPECNFVRKLDSSSVTENDNQMFTSVEYPKFLGNDPVDQGEITLRKGPYGLYVQKDLKETATPVEEPEAEETKSKTKKTAKKTTKSKTPAVKPKRVAVPKFVDSSAVDIKTAIMLLQLPKTIGLHNNSEVKIGIGRFGPYILFEGKYSSIKKPETMFTMSLDEAVQIINKR